MDGLSYTTAIEFAEPLARFKPVEGAVRLRIQHEPGATLHKANMILLFRYLLLVFGFGSDYSYVS